MSTLKIVPSELKKIAAEFRRSSVAYGKDVTNVYKTVGELGAVWVGEPSKAFQNDVNSYKTTFEQLEKDLISWADFLDATADEYKKIMASLTSAFNG